MLFRESFKRFWHWVCKNSPTTLSLPKNSSVVTPRTCRLVWVGHQKRWGVCVCVCVCLRVCVRVRARLIVTDGFLGWLVTARLITVLTENKDRIWTPAKSVEIGPGTHTQKKKNTHKKNPERIKKEKESKTLPRQNIAHVHKRIVFCLF